MDRLSVVKWLRDNPDVDVTSLVNEAKAQWGCALRHDRTITAEATNCNDGSIRIPIDQVAHIFLKPDDAAAFARHILELVKS